MAKISKLDKKLSSSHDSAYEMLCLSFGCYGAKSVMIIERFDGAAHPERTG
jgi:hypothetical protein